MTLEEATAAVSVKSTAAVGWFSKFEDYLEVEAQKAEAWIKQEAALVKPVLEEYSEEFIQAIASLAWGAVTSQVPLLIAGTEKFGAAVVQVVQGVELNGKQIAITDAQAAVTAAFNKLTAKATAAQASS